MPTFMLVVDSMKLWHYKQTHKFIHIHKLNSSKYCIKKYVKIFSLNEFSKWDLPRCYIWPVPIYSSDAGHVSVGDAPWDPLGAILGWCCLTLAIWQSSITINKYKLSEDTTLDADSTFHGRPRHALGLGVARALFR